MVRLADPVAINRDDSAPDTQIGETAEVLERRIQAEYDEALEQERIGNQNGAQVQMLKAPTKSCLLNFWLTQDQCTPQALFKQLLAEPALQNITGGTVTALAHARYLVLKNLAGSLAHDDATCKEALQFYVEASELDCSDTVLWHRLGSLVRSTNHVMLPGSTARSELSNSYRRATTMVYAAGW